MNRPEYILCAAIWIDTGKAEPPRRTYTYPATGLVFAGWRHADCWVALSSWLAHLSERESEALDEQERAGKHEGFITSTGRFVDREDAGCIAFIAEQVSRDGLWLTSEDLY